MLDVLVRKPTWLLLLAALALGGLLSYLPGLAMSWRRLEAEQRAQWLVVSRALGSQSRTAVEEMAARERMLMLAQPVAPAPPAPRP